MRIFVVLIAIKVVYAELYQLPVYEGARDAIEAPRYQEILKKILPNGQNVNSSRNGRIINGNVAELGQFPYQTLQYMTPDGNAWYTCGGSLIKRNWVLTAAHCIEEYNRVDLYVGLVQRPPGQYQFTTIITGRNNLIIHPQRNVDEFSYDIGLLRLENAPLDLLDLEYVGVVQLPMSEHIGIELGGEIGLFSGFGRTGDSVTSLSQILRYARAPIMANPACANIFGSVIRNNTVCINTAANNTGTCSGDSGGPLTVSSIFGEGDVIAGVVSFGSAISCVQGYPSVFARVTHFVDWINEVVNEEPGPPTQPTPPPDTNGCVCNCHCHTCPSSDLWRK